MQIEKYLGMEEVYINYCTKYYMKAKKVLLLLVVALVASSLTGCIHYDIDVTIDQSGSGTFDLVVATPEQENFSAIDLSGEIEVFSEIEDVEFTQKDVEYQESGITYIGKKITADFDQYDTFFKSLSEANKGENDGLAFKFTQLPNGNKKLSIYPNKTEGQDSGGGDLLFSQFQQLGGRISFSITTELSIVNHNADKVTGNTYYWDILNTLAKAGEDVQNTEFFIEVADGSESPATPQPSDPVTSQLTFSDISETNWYYNDVMELARRGIISGVKEAVDGVSEYGPEITVSFGQFIAIATRLVTPEYIEEIPNAPSWATKHYEAAVRSGLIFHGFFEGTVEALNAGISREDMALILVDVALINGEELEIKEGIEEKIPDFYEISYRNRDAVLKAYSNGLLVGDADGNFNPKDTLKRSEVAAVFCRVMNYTKRPSLD
jgi:hypothetical protein